MKNIRWKPSSPLRFWANGLFLLTCALVLLSLPTGGHSKRCKEYLMKSYHLDGMHEAVEMANPLCPTLEHSCCSKVLWPIF